MIIREAEYESCNGCGSRRRVKAEAHGCDLCKKIIDLDKRHVEYHDVTVFFRDGGPEPKHHFLCSVRCVTRWLKAFKPPKNFSFVNLPLLSGAKRLRAFQDCLRSK